MKMTALSVIPSSLQGTSAPATKDFYGVIVAAGANSLDNDFANAEKCDKSILSNIKYTIKNSTIVSDLRGKTNQGDKVDVTFTVNLRSGMTSHAFTLVICTAPRGFFRRQHSVPDIH